MITMDDYWAGVSDRYGDAHLRDVQAGEDRREKVRAHKGWVLSEVGPLARPLTQGWAMYRGYVRRDIELIDAYGRSHWITEKQYRIYLTAITLLDTSTSMRKIAASIGVCVTTVSTMMRKLMAWGLLAYLSSRGRYGGITLFRRSKGDGMDRYARMAQQAIREWWSRKMARLRTNSNVQSLSGRVGKYLPAYPVSSSVDIKSRDDRIEAILIGMQHGMMKRVPCPAHEGEGRNLSFWRRQDGSLGVKCWSHQCTSHEIKDAIEPFGA